MSDYYHHFLSSITGVGGTTTPGRQDIPLPPQPPPGMALGVPPMPNAYQSLGYFTGFPDPLMYSASPSSKASQKRRKSAPGLDHIKHRRTRSGCYTCRSRRVKASRRSPLRRHRRRSSLTFP